MFAELRRSFDLADWLAYPEPARAFVVDWISANAGKLYERTVEVQELGLRETRLILVRISTGGVLGAVNTVEGLYPDLSYAVVEAPFPWGDLAGMVDPSGAAF